MVRLLFLQCFKHQIHRILELFVILTDLHGIDELDQGGEVLLLLRCFIMDIADQCTVEQRFRLIPERITALTIAFGVGHESRGQLQNVLLRMDIGKWVIVHRLFEVDGVEDLDPVPGMDKCIADL